MDWLRTTWLVALFAGAMAVLASTAGADGPALVAEPVPMPSPMPATDTPPTAADLAQGTDVETLEQAWQWAVDSNLALESKRHLVAAGKSDAQAAAAEKYPNVLVGAGYTARDQEPAYLVPPSVLLPGFDTLPTAQRDAFSFQTTIEVPLYTSGRIGHQVAAASAEQRAAYKDFQTAVANLKLRVAYAYIAVLREQHVVQVASEREANLQAHLTDTRNLLVGEQVPRNDLLAAEVALANASQQRLQAQNRLAMARAEYNRLLQRSLDAPVQLAPLTVTTELPTLETFCLSAGQGRPELARLGAQSRALDRKADAVRAGAKPQLELLGQYVFEENRYRSPEGIAALAFGVEWNAFDSARSRHAARAIEHRAASYRRAMADLQAEIELEIRRAWLSAGEALERTEVARSALAQADENLAAARNRYNTGVGSDTKVLDAVLLRSEAGLNYHHAICDAVLAACQLRHATGDL